MYQADPARYGAMAYPHCGASGLRLPAVSLGFWHNFGDTAHYDNMKAMCFTAFDHGITHFDLANNYGPAPGAAETNLGRILREELHAYRDELIISTKAGYTMWEGPYGDFGSRKYLLASLDQSLRRMGLDYVDIFYHHRPDPNTPLEETMQALADIVHQGKALYVGVSNYNAEQTQKASAMLREMGVPLTIHQPRYNMLDRWIEAGTPSLCDVLLEQGIGSVVFSPLAQGILTDRYLHGVPEDSRAGASGIFLRPEQLTDALLDKVRQLQAVALNRGETMAQLALGWVLENPAITSVIIGASRLEQIQQNVAMLQRHHTLSEEEKQRIRAILEA